MKPSPNIPNLWLELVAILLRKPRPSVLAAAGYPAGQSFPVANGPVTSILVPIVLIGLVGDIPLSFVVVALAHASHPMVIHVIIAVTYLLSLGWATAVRSTLRCMPHVVSRDALWMGGCVRLTGVIPKEAIAGSVHLRISRFAWMSEQGISRNDVLVASGFDSPNVALEIGDGASEVVRIYGRKGRIPARRWLMLYADNPVGLMQAVHALEMDPAGASVAMAANC